MCSRCQVNRRALLRLLPAAAAVLAGPLAACGGPATGPEDVRWGRENCDYCGMIIDDRRFAGELRDPAGRKVWKFDDIGCAAMFLAKQSWTDSPRAEVWVGDSERGTWLDGRKARYLAGARTPMNYGFAAVDGDRPGALTFAEFRKAVAARGSTSRCDHPDEGRT